MLANQIKTLRIKAGMSQIKLADKLNVSPSAIGMYEQGRRIPAIDILVQMAKLFEVSLDYLIIGTEQLSLMKDKKVGVIQSACPCRGGCFCCNNLKFIQTNNLIREGSQEGLNR